MAELPPVTVPVRVDWWTMMGAKVGNATRPSRLALLAFASCALGAGVGTRNGTSISESSLYVLGIVVAVRLALMAASSALDAGARRRFTGALTFSADGVVLTPTAGDPETHAWSWVLGARLKRDRLAVRLAERGGRVLLRLSVARLDAPSREGLVAHFRNAGKLDA
jgi:hypothetical protein